jgi:hypothetical protein
MLRAGVRFRRVERRRRALAFVLGLLAGLPQANCWSIGEHAGDASPAGMQHLMSRGYDGSVWDLGSGPYFVMDTAPVGQVIDAGR